MADRDHPEGDVGRLGDASFVALSTFRRSGVAVSTAVWVVRDEDQLYVWTGAKTGKVKRLRRDPRVRLARCGRLGRVRDGEPVTEGSGEVVEDPAVVSRVEALLRRTYGFQFSLVVGAERIFSRGEPERVALRIALDAT